MLVPIGHKRATWWPCTAVKPLLADKSLGRVVAGRTVTQVSGSGSAASTRRGTGSKTCSLQAALAVRGQDSNAEAVWCCAKMQSERMLTRD